jgi:thiosulfate reductase cytochrome b subunit
MSADGVQRPTSPPGQGHALWVRLLHWLIAGTVITLAYTGVVILMAHPRLYWGSTGNDLTTAWLELPLGRNYRHGGWGTAVPFFADPGGPVSAIRTYDIFNLNGWARSFHFLVAWLFAAGLAIYLAAGLLTGHLRRALLPGAGDLSPRRLWEDMVAHLRAKPAAGGPPYGLLQKWAYVGVVLVALPVMVLSGLAMSPAAGIAAPFLPAMFGGSQSARTIHFLFLCALALFLAIHLVMVVVSGFWRQMRVMTWGR